MTSKKKKKTATLLRTLHDVLWRHKDGSTERNISNGYKETMFYVIFELQRV